LVGYGEKKGSGCRSERYSSQRTATKTCLLGGGGEERTGERTDGREDPLHLLHTGEFVGCAGKHAKLARDLPEKGRATSLGEAIYEDGYRLVQCRTLLGEESTISLVERESLGWNHHSFRWQRTTKTLKAQTRKFSVWSS